MKILIITFDYPDERRSIFPFVKQLVEEWARQDHECIVVAPYSITSNRGFHQYRYLVHVESGKDVYVYRPNYISTSNFTIAGINLSKLLHKFAVQRVLKNLDFKPDLVYCHFWDSAVEALPYVIKNEIPLFVASGESSIPPISQKISSKLKDFVRGVICVSSKNRDESISKGLTIKEKCIVIPNAVNGSLFHKEDKEECRKKLGLPLGSYIVAFVGWFSERKGSMRVSDAIKFTNSNDIYSLFIGKGIESPNCDNILFIGSLRHDEIPIYLNAADVFVLPTLAEGCCNAIVEAMACGLPIISSNLPFNWDILNDDNSILVDPLNIQDLANAIIQLKEDNLLYNKLASNALLISKELTIDRRSRKIIEFMKSSI